MMKDHKVNEVIAGVFFIVSVILMVFGGMFADTEIIQVPIAFILVGFFLSLVGISLLFLPFLLSIISGMFVYFSAQIYEARKRKNEWQEACYNYTQAHNGSFIGCVKAFAESYIETED